MITLKEDLIKDFLKLNNSSRIEEDLKCTELIEGDTISFDINQKKFIKSEKNLDTVSPVLILDPHNFDEVERLNFINLNNYYSFEKIGIINNLGDEALLKAADGLKGFINRSYILDESFMNQYFKLLELLINSELDISLESVFSDVVDVFIDNSDLESLLNFLRYYNSIDAYLIVDHLKPKIDSIYNHNWGQIDEEHLLLYAFIDYIGVESKFEDEYLNKINAANYTLRFKKDDQLSYAILLNVRFLDKLKFKVNDDNVKNKFISSKLCEYFNERDGK